jgi:hypothetical protein
MRRVKIVTPKGYQSFKEFEGCTGTVVGFEMDGRTKMHRVKLDEPVMVHGVGLVKDDIWSGKFLRTIRS